MHDETMSYAARLQREVSRYTPADRLALAEFRREMFGRENPRQDEDYFQWLFEHNPCRPADGAQIWICRKGGKIVGHQAGIPFQLKVANGYHRASWAIDLVVQPQWRLRGVGPVLSQTHAAANGIVAGLGISDAAFKAFLRAGWTDMGSIPLYVRPLDARRMLRHRNSPGPLASLAGRAANPFLRFADAVYDAYVRCKGVTVQLVERFDERVDALWASCCDSFPVIARRDFRSLRWRFDDLPDPRRYQRLYLLQGSRLRGYAVTRLEMMHGAKSGVIVDYLSTPQWVTPLIAGCVKQLQSSGAAAVYCSSLCHSAGLFMPALGFIRRRSGLRFMVLPNNTDPSSAGLITGARNWFITSADSDAEHPDHRRRRMETT